MSKRTALCIVNCSGRSFTVEAVAVSGFDDPAATALAKFNGQIVPRDSSSCGYVEIKNRGASPFSLTFTFDDGTTCVVSCDQQDARSKRDRELTTLGTASGVVVRQRTGGDIDRTTHGTHSITVSRADAPDHADWMRDLRARRPGLRLCDVTMPGSHDAGMYITPTSGSFGGGKAWAQTQSLSMRDQLAAGSRYFDLRVYSDRDGTLFLAHFPGRFDLVGSYGASLAEVLRQTWEFLSSHRGETVILKFSHTDALHGGATLAGITAFVGQALHGWQYTSDDPDVDVGRLSLDTLAGKVLTVFDDEYDGLWNAATGTFRYDDEPKDGTRAERVAAPARLGLLRVYDRYANESAFDAMYKDQREKWLRMGGLGAPYLFPLSWTATGSSATLDVEVLANGVNPWLPRSLTAMVDGDELRPNIVYLNFVDPDLCGAIIATGGRAGAP
ncbi:MAG TPA: hypothetical protein PKA64_07715 [Myxococcota bacterium]|nr:hypothetical protein [Myxococcota bacterium]